MRLTQEAIARRSRTSAKFVSQIENGHSSPSVDLFARIVELGLGVPMSAFFAGDAESLRDELAQLAALFAGQSAATRKRALRVLRALVDE
jgi:transcriptional regulator with XRE-family HTH domain